MLKFFAVCFGLLGVSTSILTQGRRAPTPRNSSPTFAKKLLMHAHKSLRKTITDIHGLIFSGLAWVVSSEHVVYASGQGSPAIRMSVRANINSKAEIFLGGENRAVMRETTQDRPLKMLYMSVSFAEG